MKRKVRIYKDPFGQGGYINKTAQWLRKAQEGAETGMTPVTAGIMQQMQPAQQQMMQQQQPQQDPQEQILQVVVALAQQGKGEDEIKDYLLTNVYGFEEGSQEYAAYEPQILDFVSAVFERSAPEEEEQAVTNEPIEDIVADTSVEDTSEEDGNYDQMINDIIYDDEDQEARYGGVPNKRSYVNKLIRQLKKAQKGDQVEEANTANVRGTEDNPTSDAPGNKNPFISGVKGQAENHFYKQQAEQMYNNQFGQGMPQAGMSQPQDDMDYAQRGGWRMRRANRKMFGTPNLPMGVTSSKYSFGPLGGVRSAEMQFNPLMMASMFPMMTFPGMGGSSSWGYNEPYRKTTKGRLVTEKIASTVNNKSIEDVANDTDSDAANKSAEPKKDTAIPNADGTVTVDTSGEGASSTTPGTTPNTGGGTGPVPIDGARQAMELRNKKDKWGRSRADKWYGFDPATKKWTLTAAPDWYKEPSKKSRWSNVTMKKDSWGRNEDSKWYGYDSKKKKYTEGPNKGKTTTQVKNKLEDQKNKELIKKFPKLKEQIEYDSWYKNASGTDRVLGLLGFGPSDPSFRGGFTDDDALSYVTPMGIKGATEAFKLTPAAERILRGERLNIGSGMAASFRDPKAQQAANAIYKNFYKSVRSAPKGLPEPPPGTQLKFNFAAGGFVNNPMQDQFGNLQKFIYGDQVDDQMLENLYQPPINQSDLDYSDSEDPSDPYFKKHGGLHRFDGTTNSQTNPTNAPKTYTQEELDKMLAEKQKSWETDYQKKYNQQMQGQQQMMQGFGGYGAAGYNPYDSYSAWSSRGNYGGFGPMASTGLLGAAGNLIKGFGRGPSTYGPAGNPLQYAATAAQITKSGMLPTGMKYSKEKAEGFLGKLGLKNDKVWTLDYATPEQIKAGAIPGAQGTAPGTNQNTSNMSGRDRRINRRDERLNRNTPAEADAYQFTGTLTGSPVTYAKEPLSNEEMLKSQGKMWDEKQQKWVTGSAPTKNTEMAYGGFIPDYMAYGGDLPTADNGINFSTVSYEGNPVIGVEESPTWGAMQYFNQNQNIKNPDADKFKNYTIEPEGEDLTDCTYEQKLDPTSKCYEPQTAQLKIKEEKGKMDPTKLSRGVLDFGANLADAQDYMTERRTKYIPGMTEFAMGEKQDAEERINKGEWNARTGKEGIQGFEGVIRKGGSIKSKKSKASGHKINISDFQDLMRLAGLK